MINKLLLGTLVLSMSAATAFAADLPSRRAPPVYVPPPLPVFSWTGAYIGVNAGYAFDNKTNYGLSGNNAGSSRRIATGTYPGYTSANDNGFTGGLQIGYNYELGNGFGLPVLGSFGGLGGGGLVAGVEADAAYTDLNDNSGIGGNAAFHSRTDYVGTVRGRLGIAFSNALLYGTGGFAYGGVRNSVALTGAGAAFGSTDRIRAGYAYGGGVEYAIPTSSFVNVFNAGAVTLKVEYIHYELGSDSIALTNGGGNGSYTARIRNDGNLVRAGLNYKFNFLGAAAPVVARY